MYVIMVCSNICASSCGVLRFIVGLGWLWMHSIVVSEGSTYWYYLGHSGVGLYSMVCRGMVAMVCMSSLAVNRICCGVQSLWLIMSMVAVFASSLVANLAQWMASTVVLWSTG